MYRSNRGLVWVVHTSSLVHPTYPVSIRKGSAPMKPLRHYIEHPVYSFVRDRRGPSASYEDQATRFNETFSSAPAGDDFSRCLRRRRHCLCCRCSEPSLPLPSTESPQFPLLSAVAIVVRCRCFVVVCCCYPQRPLLLLLSFAALSRLY
ncbi:hypothetical protein BHE74_00057783 [Ensete ventricosum]|nr:hypothetical protein BHE74_00057783 [Ensete ventricosum]